MIQEKYQVNVQEVSFNVTQNRVDSIRKKNITRTGYRIYDQGCMGVFGELGDSGLDPWAEAKAKLADQIAYPFSPVENRQESREIPSDLDADSILLSLEQILEKARKRHPEFLISNKVNILEKNVSLENDCQTRLSFKDRSLQVGLLLKHRDSVNIMDSFLDYQSRHWDPDFFLNELSRMVAAYNNLCPLPDEPLYVVTSADLLTGKLVSELNGEKVGYKNSLLMNDFGRQAFHEQFCFYLDWDPNLHYHNSYFDAEGTIIESGRVNLIENGVVRKAYTDKRTADRFHLPLTGSAACAYDGVPSLGAFNFSIERSGQTLKSLLNGRKGLIVVMASGGDYTDEGRFASPVQLALLTDGDRIIGRVPECSISGHLYDIFGKDYIGYSQDKFLFNQHALVVKMKIEAGRSAAT